VAITVSSREIPGRKACDKRHPYCIIIIIIIIIIIYLTATNELSPGGSGYNACT